MNFALELKNMQFAKFNVDHSFWHYGPFVSGQHCAWGMFYLGLGYSKICQKQCVSHPFCNQLYCTVAAGHGP